MSGSAIPKLLGILVFTGLLGTTVGLAASLGLSSHALTLSTATYGSALTCTINAAADSHVRSDQPSTNFGTSTTLEVNSASSATTRSLARFDLSTCAIPAGAIVHSAKVRLTQAAVALATRTYDARLVTGSWAEGSVTWANQPIVAAQVTSSVTVPILSGAGTIVEWSVVGDAQSFVSGAITNHGWRINDSAEGTLLGNSLTFGSREASSGRPQLVIVYVA